jgi:TP53 regulating kinase-like protein
MMKKIIEQGAEAVLIHSKNKLIKKRISKSYRHPILDKTIRKTRTRKEAKLLEKVSNLINVPKIVKTSEYEIHMEFINGKKLSEHLDKFSINKAISICYRLGENIAILHNKDIVHGDLTTSNLILKNNKIYFIDFGLGFHSSRIEDKAVDLHLLRQALESKHFKNWKDLFAAVIQGYKKLGNLAVLEQLKKVESRGRYKGKYNGKQPMVV